MSRVKGSPKTGGRKKGTKNKMTLLKEERRAIFDEEIDKIWRDVISRLKPEYAADQYMGKAPEVINLRIPKPILDGLSNNNGDKKDSESHEEN